MSEHCFAISGKSFFFCFFLTNLIGIAEDTNIAMWYSNENDKQTASDALSTTESLSYIYQ